MGQAGHQVVPQEWAEAPGVEQRQAAVGALARQVRAARPEKAVQMGVRAPAEVQAAVVRPTLETTPGGTTDGGGTTGDGGGRFSFFMTSLASLRKLSGNQNGFGGDLRFGGKANGLEGADEICKQVAEIGLPGNGKSGVRS